MRRRTHLLRDLTGRSCLNGATQERSEFCGPTLGSSTAGCPERSAGTRVAGCASLLTFLHKQESKALPGATRPAKAKTTINIK
jgi:hypothetical protein